MTSEMHSLETQAAKLSEKFPSYTFQVDADFWKDIFSDFDNQNEIKEDFIYVRPGGGSAFYVDQLRIKTAAQKVNEILGVLPLIQQMGLEYKGSWIGVKISRPERNDLLAIY